VDIVSEDGLNVPPGVIGEIVVSGPNVMSGYFSGDESTSGRIDPFGRLHTGDLGQFDDDRYLYVVARQSELIKTAGERVFPREIEAVLDAHPEICESAVLGIPDHFLGEKIVACVVPKPGTNINPERIRTHCLKSLPLVRVPREIRFCDGLPKTTTGKIDRRALSSHFHDHSLTAVRATSATEHS
jgi:acyl-CoA synthetase (AMP-forming)/AMP-acid ligase II